MSSKQDDTCWKVFSIGFQLQAALDIKVLQLEQVRQQRRPEVVEKAALSSVAKAQVLVEAAEERVEVLKQSCSKVRASAPLAVLESRAALA